MSHDTRTRALELAVDFVARVQGPASDVGKLAEEFADILEGQVPEDLEAAPHRHCMPDDSTLGALVIEHAHAGDTEPHDHAWARAPLLDTSGHPSAYDGPVYDRATTSGHSQSSTPPA